MREKSAFHRCQRMIFVEHDVIICKLQEKKLEFIWSDPWKGPICLGGVNDFRYHPLVQQFSTSPFLSPGTGRLKLSRDRDFPFTIVPGPGLPATYSPGPGTGRLKLSLPGTVPGQSRDSDRQPFSGTVPGLRSSRNTSVFEPQMLEVSNFRREPL
jgi:hypothetical protein